MAIRSPLGLLAELTHRCSLRCPYCSNPLDLERRSAELGTATWLRIFEEAAALGILHIHLSGGEPAARADLVALTRGAAQAGLYTNLITSGIGLDHPKLEQLADAGLDHVQLSIQDVLEDEADRIAGLLGAHARKRAVARDVVALGLPLTLNAVVHRGNIDRVGAMITEAAALGARRIEVAHAQYYGWALCNRNALLPSADQVAVARQTVERARGEHRGALVIDYVASDYFARYPKACVNGWGRQSLNVTPSGKVLPCHAAESIPGLTFWTICDHSLRDIWERSPGFMAFRGTDWMREPCASCPRKQIDFGGCRCQAFALTGDARNADPVCTQSPMNGAVRSVIGAERSREQTPAYRNFANGPFG